MGGGRDFETGKSIYIRRNGVYERKDGKPVNHRNQLHSDLRLQNAMNADKPSSREENKKTIDKIFRSDAEAWFNSLTSNEKKAVEAYIDADSTHAEINRGLAGTAEMSESTKELIRNLSSALEKSEIKEDIWISRSISYKLAGKMLGVPYNDYDGTINMDDVQKIIDSGKVFTADTYLSTSPTYQASYPGSLDMRIFVPSGTKGAYLVPIAENVLKDGWDGGSTAWKEFEMLLQRGYKLKATGIEHGTGRNHTDRIVFEIVGEDKKEI